MNSTEISTTFRKRRLFPRTLSKCAEKALAPVFKEKHPLEAEIIRHWPELAGEALADCVLPYKIQRTGKESLTLILRVAGVSALEMQYHTPFLLEKIRTFFGTDAVKKITVQPMPEPEAGIWLEACRKAKAATQKPKEQILQSGSDPLEAALVRLEQTFQAVRQHKH